MTAGPPNPSTPPRQASGSRVEAVVTAYNERPDVIRRTVAALVVQPDVVAVHVIDDGSASLVEVDLPNVTVVRQDNRGVSAARNNGLRAVAAPYLASVDVDVLVPVDWVGRLVDYLGSHPSVAAVWSRLDHAQPSLRATWWLDCQEHTRPPRPAGETAFAPGRAVVFRTAALRAVDGWDESVDHRFLNEDHDVCTRLRAAGHQIHGVWDPAIASEQDLSIRELARKDLYRMQAGGLGRRRQATVVLLKTARRVARHLLCGPRRLAPLDVWIGLHSMRPYQKLSGSPWPMSSDQRG